VASGCAFGDLANDQGRRDAPMRPVADAAVLDAAPLRDASRDSARPIDGGGKRIDGAVLLDATASACTVGGYGGDSDVASGDAGRASCMMGGLAPGDSTVTVQHCGATRTFLLHVPESYDGTRAVPLVLDMHGYTSSAVAQRAISGWLAKSDEEGFLLVHPNGLDASWNGGSLCCGNSQKNGVDDEGFLRAVVKRMQQDACIDDKRVYATGLSNGGAMSHLLACRAADVFAATAPVVMGNGTRPCAPSRPISVVMFRGLSDPLVPYGGGLFPSAAADLEQWKALNGCTGPSSRVHEVCETYSDCSGGVEVTLCTIDAGHVLYRQATEQGADIPDVVWEVFERQPLP
jgi:polyhydroxybutyrate depolymerase